MPGTAAAIGRSGFHIPALLLITLMITVAGATFQTDKVFVGVLIFAISGMVATEMVDRAERKFDKWRPRVGSE